MNNIRLGLCCSILTLRYKNDIYSSRRRNLKTIIDGGLEDAKNTAKENVVDLLKMIFWAKNHGINVMRISSELVPHGNNIELIKKFGNEGKEYLSLVFLQDYLEIIGKIARLEDMRLTFHPGQFVQLGAHDKNIYDSSVRELNMHASFLDLMGMNEDSVIVIHLGGTYCDKQKTIKRFISQFKEMDEKIKRRIVLENDEKCYDAEEVLEICKELNVPMVFDIHHYQCYKLYHKDIKQKSIEELMPGIIKTWKGRGIRMKVHLSEQMNGKVIGSHSLFIEKIPEEFLSIPDKYGEPVDIMIEAKGKEIAISKLYSKYPKLKPKSRKELPKTMPKEALKDLLLPEEIKEEVRCECAKNDI